MSGPKRSSKLIPQHILEAVGRKIPRAARAPMPRVAPAPDLPTPQAKAKPARPLHVQPSAKGKTVASSDHGYEQRREAEAEARGRSTMAAIAEAARPVAPAVPAQPQLSS